MKIIFYIGILFILIVPVYIGVFRNASPGLVWAVVICGAFVIIASKIDILQELSLGPLRARMKEQILEATATIKQLKEISAVSAEATLTNLMAGCFMDGMSFDKRVDLHDKIITSLKEIGATQEEIDKVETNWRKGIAIIYHRNIKEIVEERKSPNTINPNAPENAKKAGQELQELLDFNTWSAPAPQQIQMVLDKYKIESDEVAAWITDYDYFLKTGEIQNKDRFIQFSNK